MSYLFSGLTQADLETNDPTKNGTSNGVDGDTGNKEIKLEVKEDEEEAAQVTTPQYMLTSFELEGLCNLLGKLEELPAHKKCVPAGIRNAAALLEDMRVGVASQTHTDYSTFKQLLQSLLLQYCFYGAVPW